MCGSQIEPRRSLGLIDIQVWLRHEAPAASTAVGQRYVVMGPVLWLSGTVATSESGGYVAGHRRCMSWDDNGAGCAVFTHRNAIWYK